MRCLAMMAVGVVLVGCDPTGEPAQLRRAEASGTTAELSSEPVTPPLLALSAQKGGPTSGAIVLATLGDRRVALVADGAARALQVVDLDANAALSSTPLAGAPSAVLVENGGRIWVALGDAARVQILEAPRAPTDSFESVGVVPVPVEPVAMLATPGGDVLVASRWGHALTSFDPARLVRRFTLDLPRDPTAMALSSDGTKAYVAHAVGGQLSEVSLDEPHGLRTVALGSHRTVEPGACGVALGGLRHEEIVNQSYSILRASSGAIVLPAVLVDPVPIVDGLSASYGGRWWSREPSARFVLATVGPGEEPPKLALSPAQGLADCLLPRAAALDESAHRVLVTCLGRDEVMAYDLASTSGTARATSRWRVPAGPTAIVVDSASRSAVVWSDFDGVLSVLPLSDGKRAPELIRVAGQARLEPKLARGRRLFYAADTSRVSFDGRACASCHLDGRDDAITWMTRQGPRQTPMLVGRLDGTAPFGWEGEHATLEAHFASILDRLGGAGLDKGEQRDLFAWIESLSPPAEPGSSEDAWVRGQEVFQSAEAGCSRCHAGEGRLTDRARHDVGTGSRHDPGPFDTPSLRFVGRSAPYLHDGRFPTVRATLLGLDEHMGRVGVLAPQDLDALVHYVESL